MRGMCVSDTLLSVDVLRRGGRCKRMESDIYWIG